MSELAKFQKNDEVFCEGNTFVVVSSRLTRDADIEYLLKSTSAADKIEIRRLESDLYAVQKLN